jgi:TRAP-type C4-dicarboxylate transport system permease small subunit
MPMSNRIQGNDVPVRRIDRVLVFMSLGILVLSILCFFAVIIGTWLGMHQADFLTGAWPVVAVLPLIGLPIAFVLMMVVIIMSFVRRARANRGK